MRKTGLAISITESTGPLDTPWGVRLQNIEDRIIKSEATGITARWESGMHLLKRRDGKQVPNGLLDEAAAVLSVSRRELGYRIRFAEAYPDKEQVGNALQTWKSWRDVIKTLPAKSPSTQAAKQGVVVKEMRTFIRRMKTQLHKVHAQDLTESDFKVLDAIQDEIARIYDEVEE